MVETLGQVVGKCLSILENSKEVTDLATALASNTEEECSSSVITAAAMTKSAFQVLILL